MRRRSVCGRTLRSTPRRWGAHAMKSGWLMFIAGMTACNSASTILEEVDGSPGESRVPDAASESGLDGDDADAGPCADCEYFPETCAADVFCPNGPFDPDSPGGSLDARTTINVIRGRSSADIWVAGSVGGLAHFDGAAWTRSDLGSQET